MRTIRVQALAESTTAAGAELGRVHASLDAPQNMDVPGQSESAAWIGIGVLVLSSL